MVLQNSFELLKTLKELEYLETTPDLLWWPQSGTFEVVAGALLTQQSKWEKVEASLSNLKSKNLLSIESLAIASVDEVSELIRPSGFYNTKARRLINLCQNILDDFGTFEAFSHKVSREWLLAQKGLGMESVDAILCYACQRPVMVVDSYTQRLVGALGYTFEDYEALQQWLQEGIETHIDAVYDLYKERVDLPTVYARFHGKIVEYAKKHIRGKEVDISPLLNAQISGVVFG